MLSELHELRIDRELAIAADIVDDLGWSRWCPIHPIGAVSFPTALAMACAARETDCDTEEYAYLYEAVPRKYKERFSLAWDSIEYHTGMDVVTWNGWHERSKDLLEDVGALARNIRFYLTPS